ncbi:MAG: apolipoprotein N-acyltransferase, partial [Candidatus Sumerlaeia bacterium]|nr:apolipoprotein N-acyltransferase [Candidatus Sumerlaeia bacterium]
LIVLGNTVLARLVEFCLNLRRTSGITIRKFPILPLLIFVVLIVGNLWYGKLALLKYTSSEAPSLTISIVQPNVPQPLKLASYISPDENERKQLQLQLLQNLTNLLLTLKEKSALIICPETAITDPFFAVNRSLQNYIHKVSQTVNTPILFGADEVVLSTDEKSIEKIYNSAWLVEPDKGLTKTVYRKIHLVPFGEYVPLGGIIPFLQESIVQVGNFDAGRESTIFSLRPERLPDDGKYWRFGVMICFESSFSYLARRLVERGANFLVVITNDAWYGRSSGAYQHFALSIFRAIEFRRPVVRSANTGISAVINSYGKILDSLPLETEGVLTNTCSREETITIYCAYREFFVYFIILCLLLLWLVTRVKTGNVVKSKVR